MSEDGRNLPNVVRLSVIAAIGGFLFGFDSGVINGTVEGLQLPLIQIESEPDLTSPQCSWGVPLAPSSPGSWPINGVDAP